VPTSEEIESHELRREKEVSPKETYSCEVTRGGEKNAGGDNTREEGVWRLNLSRYSKWYRVKQKGETRTWLVSSKSESLGTPILLQTVGDQQIEDRRANLRQIPSAIREGKKCCYRFPGIA